jgi:hypothetical protein
MGGYLFLPGFSSPYDAIYGWMTRRMDGKLHKKQRQHPLLYVINIFLATLLEPNVKNLVTLIIIIIIIIFILTP